MTWVALDDQAPRHPKLVAAGYHTWPLWLAGLCYCGAHLTDGFIPREVVPTLVPSLPRRQALLHASKLIVAGLWIAHPSGFTVHDYLAFNKSRARVLKERKDAADRRRRGMVRANGGPQATADAHAPPPLPSPMFSDVQRRTGEQGAVGIAELMPDFKAMAAQCEQNGNGVEASRRAGHKVAGRSEEVVVVPQEEAS